jgi:SAM-dependent methyltransferase
LRSLYAATDTFDAPDRTALPSLSVVVPHGGVEQLPQLAATVASLHQNPAVSQVIISELGPEPWARHVAERWGADYVFTAADDFDRHLALTVGKKRARHDVLAWWDNDVLLPGAALAAALAEMHQRSCDVLIPYSRIAYLSEGGSAALRRGTRALADCAVVSMHKVRHDVGGLALLRRDFLDRLGKIAGEKSRGSFRVTTRRRSIAIKLWHPNDADLGAHRVKQSRTAAHAASPASINPEQLPVWMYWEGPCPDWIAACQETARRHVPQLRLLGPREFDALWDTDRDIDIKRLQVAHRADFIRAYLLARYGGLWVDSDCIVVRPLDPLLASLKDHDFLAHRERHGYVSNAFIGARPGSAIAGRFYAQVAAAVRRGGELRWTAIGNELMTNVVNAASERWRELDTELIQPICWSEPEAFFARGSQAEHERRERPNAYCYMLSNQHVLAYQKAHPGRRLLDDDTFFSFVLKRAESAQELSDAVVIATRTEAPPTGDIEATFAHLHAENAELGLGTASRPGSTLEQTARLRECLPLLLQQLAIQSVLDVGCGDFSWQRTCKLGVRRYVGIDVVGPMIATLQQTFGDGVRSFQVLDARRHPLPRCDLILCRDLLVHLSNRDIHGALRHVRESGANYLLATTFPAQAVNSDIDTEGPRPLNLCAEPFSLPPPTFLLNETRPRRGHAVAEKALGLWRLSDLARG